MICLRYGHDRSEADDILQEGLIQIYNSLHQYEEKRAQFYTWSSRVIVHAALNYLKKNCWYKMVIDIDEIADRAVEEQDVFEKLAAEEMLSIIQKLPMGYRLVFSLHELEGYTHQEIADHLNINVGTSKSQLSKAKKMLRQLLEYQIVEK